MDADIQDILASASRARNDAAMQLGRPTASSCAAAATTMKELDLPKLDYKEIYEVLESSGKARRLGDSVLQTDAAPTTTTANNDAASSTGEPVRRSVPLDVDLSSGVNEILERRQQQPQQQLQRPSARTPTQDRPSTDAMSTVDEEVRRRLVDSSVGGTTTSPLSSISPHNVASLANNTSIVVSAIDQEVSRRLRNAIPTTTTLSSAMPDRSNTYSNGTSLSSNSVTGITTKVHGVSNRMRLTASSVRGQNPLRPLTNPTPATPTGAKDRNNFVNTVNVNHGVRAERADINNEVKRILEESSMMRRAAGIATHGPTGVTNNSNTNAVFTATPINYIHQPTTIQSTMSALTTNSPGRGSRFHNTTTSLPGIRENPRSTSNYDHSLPPTAYQSLTRSLSLEDYPPHRRRNDGFEPLHTSQSYDDHHRSSPPPSPFPPVTASRSYLSASSPSRSATRDTGTSRYDDTTNRYDDSSRRSHDPSRTTTEYKRTIVTERTSVDESSEFSGETPVSFATSNITMNWGTSWCCCVSLGPDAPCWARAALNIACFLCTLLGFLLLAFVAVSIARGEVLFFSSATSAPTVSPEPTSSPTTSPPTTSRPTRHPTYHPTKRPSPFPTARPTRGPTDRPTWHPTQRPTPFPTAFPTTSPPTAYPTTSPPTKDPTPNPSFSLTPTTSRPTLSPTKSSATVFYVTGGFFPGSQLFNEFRDSEFVTELKEAHRDGAAFVVHLGNFNDPDRTACDERFYRDVERVSVVDRTSNRVVLPVLFVNGANDYVRCPNPYQAFSYWAERLGSIERTWPDYDANVLGGVKRMDDRPENFSFVHKRVLFLGLDVVTGDVDAMTDQRKRDTDNAWWVRARVTRHYDDVDAVVLFGNEAPDANDHRFFFRTLIREVVDEAQLPTVYFYSSDREWSLRRPFDSDYFTALNVRESRFPFLETVVDPKGRMLFRFDQAS